MTNSNKPRSQADGQPVMVIDIGGTSVKFGYLVAGHLAAFRKMFSTDALRAADPVQSLCGMVRTVVADSGVDVGTIVATVPGFIDTDGDRVLTAANIPLLNGRALRTELSQALGCPVMLERDSVLTLAGEIVAGVAHGASHVLGIFFGTGVGAAYLHEGQPFRGAGWALEIGSMPFRGDNRLIAGLRTDCLEAYASGRALQEIANRHAVQISSVFEVSAKNPALATDLEEFVRYQAYAVAAATAMLSPQTIVLGGGVLDMVDFPKKRLARLIEHYAPIAETGRSMDLRWSELGWLSVLHGACAVVAQKRSGAGGRMLDRCEAT